MATTAYAVRSEPIAKLKSLSLILIILATPYLVIVSKPSWVLMWTMAFSIYICCKWLTWRRVKFSVAPAWKHLAYLLAWPGLDAGSFLQSRCCKPSDRPSRAEWLFAFVKMLFGLLCIAAIPFLNGWNEYCTGWVGMLGIVFTLHFGLFHLLSCFWRNIGVTAPPLMDWPICSQNVSEFWGRRWNRAFRDITQQYLFRPLATCWGPRAALLLCFCRERTGARVGNHGSRPSRVWRSNALFFDSRLSNRLRTLSHWTPLRNGIRLAWPKLGGCNHCVAITAALSVSFYRTCGPA